MSILIFQSPAGGQVNLNGPSTASTFDIAVPATTGTMVTTGDTGTVTSTMLASSIYTAPGAIGSGTANSGAFTTLSASSTISGAGFTSYFANPPAIGGSTPAAGSFTTLAASGTFTGNTITSAAGTALTLKSAGTTAVTINTSQAIGVGSTPSYGTSGQVLTSAGSSASPTWTTINGITLGTAQASTSGTSIDFTSIPSWVKRITVMFNGVSTNGTSNIIVQIGAGSITSSGYVSSFANNDAFGTYTSTVGFIASQWIGTTTANRNSICTLVTPGSNNWIFSIIGHIDTGASVVQTGAGKLPLGGTLDRLRITTVNGTDTFDAGSINILYE